jgi:hypothetical protein
VLFFICLAVIGLLVVIAVIHFEFLQGLLAAVAVLAGAVMFLRILYLFLTWAWEWDGSPSLLLALVCGTAYWWIPAVGGFIVACFRRR